MADNGGFLNKLKAWVRIAGDWFKWQVNLKEAEFAYKKAEKEEQIAYVLMGSTRNAANEARATFSWAAEARTAYEKAEPAEAELQKEAWVKGSAIAAQNWVVVEARAVQYAAEYQKAKDVTEDALLKFNELKKGNS